MSKFANLSTENHAKVNAKLAELEQMTGRSWSCEVMEKRQGTGEISLLEVAVDGKILRPVVLQDDDEPADRICNELDLMRRNIS